MTDLDIPWKTIVDEELNAQRDTHPNLFIDWETEHDNHFILMAVSHQVPVKTRDGLREAIKNCYGLIENVAKELEKARQ